MTHQQGVYVPLRALFLVFICKKQVFSGCGLLYPFHHFERILLTITCSYLSLVRTKPVLMISVQFRQKQGCMITEDDKRFEILDF